MLYERMLVEIVHEERLARALGTMRRQETERGALARGAARSRHGCQQATAKALVGLATRIAPTVAVPNPRAPALTQ